MPRDLSDVLHYFLPELEAAEEPPPGDARPSDPLPASPSSRATQPIRRAPPRRPGEQPPTVALLGVPIGERDVVRAALVWNLALATARLGGSSAVVTPESDFGSSLWPGAGDGPFELEVVYCPARSLAELSRAAAGLADERSKRAEHGGIVFTRIPPAWLDEPCGAQDGELAIRWLLLFASPRRASASASLESVKRWLDARPTLEIGVTIHGAQRVAEARAAFDDLARLWAERLGLAPISYGLLVDDLEVARAIASGRPIARARPETPASRAVLDVARLLYEDARGRVHG